MIGALVMAVGDAIPPGVPNPGGGVPPPGAEKFLLVVRWISWMVTLACVVGVFIVAGTMALRHRRGDGGGEAASGLGWVLFACVLVGSAGPLVTAVTT